MPINISNPSGDHSEKLDNAANVIGKSTDTLEFFKAVYTKKNQIKTVEEILQMTSIKSNVRALQVGKKLTSHDIVERIKDPVTKRIAFKKIDFYSQNRDKIIGMVKNPEKRDLLATKSRPKVTITIKQQIAKPLFSVEPITISDIDAFKKVQGIKAKKKFNPLEKDTKILFQKIIGEPGKFTDWGGETGDLFTTKLLIGGKRYPTIFGLKGRGKKGILKPGMMGKNGDQIQRLFRSPAQVVLIQYNGQIDESIFEQMRELAIAKSAKERIKIFYGCINGDDTDKIFQAYW